MIDPESLEPEIDFRYSEDEAREVAKQMFDYLNTKNKQFLEEEEVLKLLKMAYMGLRTEENLNLDDIMSYLNFHGSGEIMGKITYREFESMVVRLLSLTEKEKLDKIKTKREENEIFCKDLKKHLVDTVGEEAVEAELKSAMNLFEKYDTNQNGFIEDFEVPQILIDTYKAVGVEYTPTEDDIQQYIAMMDLDKDKKISRVEYEIFVLNSLKKQGPKLGKIDQVM